MIKPAPQIDWIQTLYSENILSFLIQNGLKVKDATCIYVNIAVMQSNMWNLMKILQSCCEVIQRTLQSGKDWLKYSSFSAISRVKWRRDQTFGQGFASVFYTLVDPLPVLESPPN